MLAVCLHNERDALFIEISITGPHIILAQFFFHYFGIYFFRMDVSTCHGTHTVCYTHDQNVFNCTHENAYYCYFFSSISTNEKNKIECSLFFH